MYAAGDMSAIDVLLISHYHYDHLDYPTVKALEPKIAKVVAGLCVGAHFRAWRYLADKIREPDWYDAVPLDELTIHVTPARHFSCRSLTRNRSLWASLALIAPARRLFFSGDSGYGPHFAEIGRRYGPFNWVALDDGQYDPRWANVNMNLEQAAVVARTPYMSLHAGTYRTVFLAAHDWDDPLRRIVAIKEVSSILWTPIIGQPMPLDGGRPAFRPRWEAVK